LRHLVNLVLRGRGWRRWRSHGDTYKSGNPRPVNACLIERIRRWSDQGRNAATGGARGSGQGTAEMAGIILAWWVILTLPQQAIGETAMAHVHPVLRRLPLLRISVLALAVLMTAATAFAQSALPTVRTTSEQTEIDSFLHSKGYMLTVAPRGTVMEVIYTEGDPFHHLPSNWYWVLLPRDDWGTKRAGWVSGRDVEYIPPPEPKVREPEPVVAPMPQPANEVRRAEVVSQPEPLVASNVADDAPEVSEVVVHFAFDKSELTDDAKAKLAEAVSMLKTHAQTVTFALQGHADATGPEKYNDKLGQARAESVKRYLAEQHQISAEKISVVSYGEKEPAASNATRDGRAQNRRVVLKVGL
jgi:outer membrane protein OmpA-like peptidoglycan-associated protein